MTPINSKVRQKVRLQLCVASSPAKAFDSKFSPLVKLPRNIEEHNTARQINVYLTDLLGHDAVPCKSARRESFYSDPAVS